MPIDHIDKENNEDSNLSVVKCVKFIEQISDNPGNNATNRKIQNILLKTWDGIQTRHVDSQTTFFRTHP